MKARRQAFIDCYNDRVAVDPNAKGTLSMFVIVEPSGRVASTQVSGDDALHLLASCLEVAVRTTTFAKHSARVAFRMAMQFPGDGTVKLGPAEKLDGKVSDAAAVVARLRPALSNCYAATLEKHPKAHGHIKVVARIGADGAVMRVTHTDGDAAIMPAFPCFESVVMKAKFSPPDNGHGAFVTIPLTFVVRD